MPTQAESVDTIITTILSRLSDALTSPKPTYTVNDQNFEWNEYVDMLFRSLDKARVLRSKLEGPVSKMTIMRAI